MTYIRTNYASIDYKSCGLDYKEFTSANGGLVEAKPYYINNSLSLVISDESGEIVPVLSKVAIAIQQVNATTGVTKSVIVTGIVDKIDKVGDYLFRYYVRVTYLDAAGDNITSATLGLNADDKINLVTMLDYKHHILPVDKNGVVDFIEYYFDNSFTITDEDKYYNGTLVSGEAQYKSPKYPIVDIFNKKFNQSIENDSVVWMRTTAKDSKDTITYNDAKGFTIGTGNDYSSNQPEFEDAYYVQVAEKVTSFPTTGNMTPSTPVDYYMPSTTAKFVGYPQGTETGTSGETLVIKDASPFYFLRPETDKAPLKDGTDTSWVTSSTRKKLRIVVNGAHQVSPLLVGTNGTLLADYLTNGHVICSGNNGGNLSKVNYDGSYNTTDWSAQRVMSVGGALIPGDGNEFYNIEFLRNDGVCTEGVIKLETRQGLIFDNCDFISEWDGNTTSSTTSTINGKPYIGTSQQGPAIKISDCHDIIFNKCTFNRKSAYVLGAIDWAQPLTGTPQLDSIVVGKEASYGKVPTVEATKSGNLTFKSCDGKNTYGQSVFSFNDVDNLDMERCNSETYYQGTPKESREVIDKPIGFLVNNNSTSMWLKGCNFYGEGIGFYIEDMKEMVYPLMENCSSIANGEEAFYFREVKYPKLRNCKGETISRNVFLFEGCEDPVLFSCVAESDTGYGFAFKTLEFGDYITKPTRYWRTHDCHILSGSGLTFDEGSLPGKIDIGTFIQTSNIYKEVYGDVVVSDRSLVGLKLWDAPYKTTIRNMYFRNIKNDVDIDKGANVELYLENTHFAGIKEIRGEYNSPAYFIHKGFSGVWEYRDIGGSITTSAVKMVNSTIKNEPGAEFSLSFKSSVNNELGRPSITLGNSNEETQYLDLVQGWNKITVYAMTRLLDVENPITDLGLWLELKYKDRSAGDPHIATVSTRGSFDNFKRLSADVDHQNQWMIQNTPVPDQKAYKIDMYVKAGQPCSAPLTVCYEHYTTVGEVYVHPYARNVNTSNAASEIAEAAATGEFITAVQSLELITSGERYEGLLAEYDGATYQWTLEKDANGSVTASYWVVVYVSTGTTVSVGDKFNADGSAYIA